ncbi:hypothetical protein CEXT_708281 [Caerostris extrusa]|uniref:Uncharacterized protein n=1 Tax=Caerostris extrusa TaxID=172846 RepID=A0AAV4Q2R2_CAEEX|nr:hypothetical protein CEXT_708281 [Caerostris extrusa]
MLCTESTGTRMPSLHTCADIPHYISLNNHWRDYISLCKYNTVCHRGTLPCASAGCACHPRFYEPRFEFASSRDTSASSSLSSSKFSTYSILYFRQV